MADDTIIAVSTPPGYGGLGIIRLSGPAARRVASRFFKPQSKKTGTLPARSPVLGDIVDARTGERLDEAVLIYFPGPLSTTREDLIEITCHGSPVILEQAVRLGVRSGARHAGPGEFTRRAYLGGRIDIIQAQAVNDLIMARTLEQAKISIRQLGGSLSRMIESVRVRVLEALTLIETAIEFPDEGPGIPPARIGKSLGNAIAALDAMIGSYDLGKTLLEGLTVVITGRPNVGKSTLFNALLEEERAIVTPYPGTTRDFLREPLRIGNSLFTLIDTAGMSTTSHPIEKEGRERGRKLAAEADGVLILIDASRKETAEDLAIIRGLAGKRGIVVLNKSDLRVRVDKDKLKRAAGAVPGLEVSALKGTNIGRLKRLIRKEFVPSLERGGEVVLHLHQKLLLEEIRRGLTEAQRLLDAGFSEEVYAEEVRGVLPSLGRLTGEIKSREVIDRIFSRFCIGK
jgi:tRNA modification GTPase